MKYLDVDPIEFAGKHDLTRDKIQCPKCGIMQAMVNPFQFEDSEGHTVVGLEADDHKCGPDFRAATMIRADPDARQSWIDFFNVLSQKTKRRS